MNATIEENLSLIFERRSIRVFAAGAVSDEAVKKMLEAAMAAPSAMTKDPWRFIVVRQPETLQTLASVLAGGKMLASAAVAIVVCGDLEAAFEQQIGFLVQDCSASIENLLLAAHAIGLGACWVGVYPAREPSQKVKEIMRLPGSLVPVAVIAIGHPGEQLPARTRYNDGYVRSERW